MAHFAHPNYIFYVNPKKYGFIYGRPQYQCFSIGFNDANISHYLPAGSASNNNQFCVRVPISMPRGGRQETMNLVTVALGPLKIMNNCY